MKKHYLLLIFVFVVSASYAQQENSRKAVFDIVDQDRSTKKVKIKLDEFRQLVGEERDKKLITKINEVLLTNSVDCPPVRKKLSENVWLCGNGKQIITDDKRLISLFNKEWAKE